MNDRHVRDKLSEYIDGMLSQEEASTVKEHLDRCPDCMEEYTEMAKIIGHMSGMEPLETPESFVEKVHERLEKASSLKKIIKRLFFPLKIKLPLELAGLAAAALLVVYITGIRGKQYVYELTFTQSESYGLLEELSDVGQKPKTEKEAKVDEIASPSKNALLTAKLEEEGKDKIEKGAESEETTPSIIEKPISAPQEIQMKKSGKAADTEKAVPRSEMVQEKAEPDLTHHEEKVERKIPIETEKPNVARAQKRKEPSLEIIDKKNEELKEEVPKKVTHREEYLREIINGLGGKILVSEYNKDTQILESVLIEVTAENYPNLIQKLEERGEIQKPYPVITEKGQKAVNIRIRLQQ